MKLLLRCGLCLTMAWIATPQPAHSQAYPTRPIRLLVAYPPGGAADLVARILQPHLRDVLGQPAVVENRGGAGGQIGAQQAAAAAPDGHTIMITIGPAHLVAKFIVKNLPYDPVKDFTPITSAVSSMLCIAANPAFPPNNVGELIAFARRNPGKVSFGTTAVGSESHLSMESIKSLAGVDMTHVPYKGGAPATTDLIGNHIPLLVLPLSTVMEQATKGNAKIIGIIFPKRFSGMPQVATVSESLPGFTSQGSWVGVYGPAGLSPAIAERFRDATAQILNAPEVRAKLEAVGQYVIANTPQQLAEQVDRAMEVYAKVVRAAGLEPD